MAWLPISRIVIIDEEKKVVEAFISRTLKAQTLGLGDIALKVVMVVLPSAGRLTYTSLPILHVSECLERNTRSKTFSWDFFGLYIMMQYDLHVARAPVVDIPIIFEAWLRSRNKWPIIIYTYIVHCSEFNCIYVQKCHSYVQ